MLSEISKLLKIDVYFNLSLAPKNTHIRELAWIHIDYYLNYRRMFHIMNNFSQILPLILHLIIIALLIFLRFRCVNRFLWKIKLLMEFRNYKMIGIQIAHVGHFNHWLLATFLTCIKLRLKSWSDPNHPSNSSSDWLN